MFADDLWNRLRVKISEEIKATTENVAAGKLASMEAYKNETGYLRGLRTVLVWAIDIARADKPSAESDEA